jgi:hypothetical protein
MATAGQIHTSFSVGRVEPRFDDRGEGAGSRGTRPAGIYEPDATARAGIVKAGRFK